MKGMTTFAGNLKQPTLSNMYVIQSSKEAFFDNGQLLGALDLYSIIELIEGNKQLMQTTNRTVMLMSLMLMQSLYIGFLLNSSLTIMVCRS